MIVVLSVDPALQSRWQRLLKQAAVQEAKALGESIILVHPGQKPNWEKLSQKLGRYASRLVVGEGIALPKERPWRRMDNSRLKEKILSNTLCSFSDSMDQVGLYDPEGRHTVLAWELAQVFPRVRVWCRFRERYDALCGDLMEQLGAAVELTSTWDGLMGCPLIGAMDAPPLKLRWDGTLLLTEKAELPPLCGTLRQNLKLAIPTELLELCPADVDPQELYLAVLQQNRTIPPGLCYLVLEEPGAVREIEKFF